MGRHNAALDDFEQILRINPGFVQVSAILSLVASVTSIFSVGKERTTKETFHDGGLTSLFKQAHNQRAKILAKEGDFAKAQYELKAYVRTKSDSEAEELVSLCHFRLAV